MTTFPELVKVHQRFPRERLENIERELLAQLEHYPLDLPEGASVAIAAGSRGITDLKRVVTTLVSFLRSRGYKPFIVPAMGSHGGATAEGQAAVLADYGITEREVGAPVRSSMEVVELPNDGLDNRVFMDKLAFEADGTVVVNRVKQHTDFHGPHESGIVKMTVIGLGKKRQAEQIHDYGVEGLKNRIVPTARKILEHGNIVMGVAIVENAYDETMLVRTVRPASFESVDAELLEIARGAAASLPIDEVDLLIVDEMGKNVSGAGMDTNVIGRVRVPGQVEPEGPRIRSIVCCDLTAESHGNAVGVGLADVITRRLFEKIDFGATYENVITSSFFERGKIPLVGENPNDAAEMALRNCGLGPRAESVERARIVRIRNTLMLDELYVSPSIANMLEDSHRIEMLRQWRPLFDDAGELAAWE